MAGSFQQVYYTLSTAWPGTVSQGCYVISANTGFSIKWYKKGWYAVRQNKDTMNNYITVLLIKWTKYRDSQKNKFYTNFLNEKKKTLLRVHMQVSDMYL